MSRFSRIATDAGRSSRCWPTVRARNSSQRGPARRQVLRGHLDYRDRLLSLKRTLQRTPKGGVMLTRCSHLAFSILLVAAVALSGCAKRPATTQASAPAPTGAATSTAATPSSAAQPAPPSSGPTGGAAATPAPSSTARPAPQDFAAVPDLSDAFFDFDKYDIRPGDAKTLDSNANWLK